MSRSSLPALAAVLASLAALAACGARSDLDVRASGNGGATSTSSTVSTSATTSVTSSSSVSSSSGPPCLSDAECDDGVKCTIDTCGPAGCEHAPNDAACEDGIHCTDDSCGPSGCVHVPNDAKCDDGKFCTVDTCVVGVGCQHQHSDAGCDDGIDCTIDTCDEKTGQCEHDACDAKCDDGNFCNGVERCDTTFGCAAGPPACALDLSCSTDTCDEGAETCAHMQTAGCAPSLRILVTDAQGKLLSVSPWGLPTITVAAATGNVHLDVAVLGGRWFTLDTNSTLTELVPMTNQIKKSFPAPGANSLGAGPDGKLYAANLAVYRIDPNTGAYTIIGSLPSGYSSSGDIAFLGNRMFVSADGPCGGALIEVDPTSGQATVLGGDGLGCVYGLAASGNTLFILDCNGKIGTFDPDTGEARVLSTVGVSVYGADVLP
jgi:hypothetical protein